MKFVRAMAGPRLTRSLAVFWAVVVTIAATGQMVRAWNALISGQFRVPLWHSHVPVIRTTEPFVFHAGLFLLLLVGVSFSYVAVKAWQHCLAARTERDDVTP